MQKLPMRDYKLILIALLVGVIIFTVFKYFSSLKEKQDLLNTLNQIKIQVAALENTKQNLTQTLEKEKQLTQQLTEENSGLKEDLKESEEKINKFKMGGIFAQKKIKKLNSEVTVLKQQNSTFKEENNLLRQEKETLNKQLTEVTQEKDNLKVKLSSLTELKKAIRELKHQVHKVGQDLKEKVKENKIVEGNHGFIIKDGKPTYPTKVKIEVIPAPKSE